MTNASEHECDNCGKQLWKYRWMADAIFGDGYNEFCSRKCGLKFFNDNLTFEKEEI